MRFKKGQQIVCIARKDWIFTNTIVPSTGPKFGEIVTCDGYNPRDGKYVFLREYNFIGIIADDRMSFIEQNFIALADITEIHELLSAVPQTEKI